MPLWRVTGFMANCIKEIALIKHLMTGALCWVAFTAPAHAEWLKIKNGDVEKARINVEVVNTPETRMRGLMDRKKLLPDMGMLFRFDRPQMVKMWMKNTYIPLDMIFTDTSGTVTHIVRNAQPHDLTPRGPDRPDTLYVLEVPAGTAMLHDIQPGDRFHKGDE